jgi:hypothetical protein
MLTYMAHTRTPQPTTDVDRSPRIGLVWAAYGAAAWSLLYGLVALGWTLTGRGFPLGENDPEGGLSLLEHLPADVGAPLFSAVALAGAGIGLLMARAVTATLSSRAGTIGNGHQHQAPVSPHRWRQALILFGTLTALGWLLVVPDARVLAIAGYLPLVIVVAPFDAELRADFIDALDWVYLNHAAVIAGGFAWAVATVVFARRTAGRCESCGRGGRRSAWSDPATVTRRGRIAVVIAMAIPAFYALTRWVWVAGYPLGFDKEVHAEGMADGSMWSGAWLGTFALVGSVLTLGLVQSWGEVFPRWLIGLRGRRVPIKLAVIPASIVSIVVTSGGLSLIKLGFSEGLLEFSADNWAAVGPALLWPLWGVALAAATYAYYLRRRGGCSTCGRDEANLMTSGRPAPVPEAPEWR